MDAAERIIVRDGVLHLTLDAVAAEAGMSKGGLLYHFPNKDALIQAMVEHLVEEANAAIERYIAEDEEPKGRYTRAILAINFPEASSREERHKRVAGALLAAVFTNTRFLDPVRAVYAQCAERLLRDGIDPVRAHVIQLAADGLWMTDMIGLPGPDPVRRGQVIEKLYQMTRE
jgi:AcrR family transcriptional regulator